MARRDDTFHLPSAFLVQNGMADLLPPEERSPVIYAPNGDVVMNLTHLMGGRGKKPEKPILLIGPDGHTPTFIAGMGQAEAAELQDIAQEQWEKQKANLKGGKAALRDWPAWREAHGYQPRDTFNDRVRQQFWDYATYLKAHQRTAKVPSRFRFAMRGWQSVSAQPWKGGA